MPLSDPIPHHVRVAPRADPVPLSEPSPPNDLASHLPCSSTRTISVGVAPRADPVLPSEPSPPKGDGRWYHFPTIDFKFQNRGRATAFLWQFAIEVLHSEIDQTPVLNFTSDVNTGVLSIQATNNGWGDAHNCHIRLDEPILNLLFSDSARQYRGTLQGGQKQDIFQFTTAAADAQQFQIIKGQFKSYHLFDNYDWDTQRQNRKRQIRGLRLSTADISWQCNDNQYNGKAQQHRCSWIVLTEYGFEELHSTISIGATLESDTTYGAIIDPSIGPYEKKYAISRKIPHGDVERFHIMVGSSMSCHLQVRFKFFIDQKTIIDSETFDISIWNPRNSQWHYEYNYTDDKNKSKRYSLYEETQSDSSVFPLASDRSHDTYSDVSSRTVVNENDIVQDSLRSRFHRLLRIFRPR